MVVPTGVPSVGAAAMVAGPKSAYAKYVLQNPALMQQVRQAHSTLAAQFVSLPRLLWGGVLHSRFYWIEYMQLAMAL